MKAVAEAPALPNPSTLGTDLEQETKLVVVRLANVAIHSTPDLSQAVLDRQDLGTRAKAVADFFRPFKDMAHKLHKGLCDRENEILGPILALDLRLKRAITDYKTEQDRIRQEAERVEADQRRRDEEARLLAEAAQLEVAGEHTLAAAAVEQALSAPVPVVVFPDATRHVEGLKFRTEWKWRYSNNNPARAMELIPREYLAIDEKKVGGYVRSMKGSGKIPGIEIYSEQVPVR